MTLRHNNFDLIRLVAATQVFVMHAIAHLNVKLSPLLAEVADWFPGVPIFFVISGYLVTASFERSPSTMEYLRNRILRIFPGLWVCLAITYIIVGVQAGLAQENLLAKSIAWFLANATIFQFVGSFGTGVANGALWSIATELQFYILIPIIGSIAWRLKGRTGLMTAVVLAIIMASGEFHDWVSEHQGFLHPWLYPVLYSSIFAHGYLFLFGVLAYIWRDQLIPFVSGKAIGFLGFYLLARTGLYVSGMPTVVVHASALGVLIYFILALLVLAAAHSAVGLSQNILRGNDYSYGIYIYHMPIIYMLIHMEIKGIEGLFAAAAIVAGMAAASWFLIERRMVQRKHYSSNLVANSTC